MQPRVKKLVPEEEEEEEACVGGWVGVITWYPAPGDLHVELNGVHAQDGVAHVAEQVAG